MYNPEFSNLIKLFYETDNIKKTSGQIKFKYSPADHYKHIIEKRAIYLDWVGFYKLEKQLIQTDDNKMGDNILMLYGSEIPIIKRRLTNKSIVIGEISELSKHTEGYANSVYFRNGDLLFNIN